MLKYIAALILLAPPILADDNMNLWQDQIEDSWSTGPMFEVENSPPPFFPFSMSGEYLAVSAADLRTTGFGDDSLVYKQWGAALSYTQPYCETWGLIFGAGWIGTQVDLENNPYFNETFFNYINFSIGAFTKAFCSWTWTATAAAFIDTENLSLADYALYQGILWGKYSLSPYLEFDVGFIMELGLNKEKFWPILGFVYLPADCWRINLIYPINIAVEYDYNRFLTFAGSIRFLRNRHRVGANNPLPQAIFEYQTAGCEFDVLVHPFEWFVVKGFAGKTLDGDFKVSNQQDKGVQDFKFYGSFYAGVSAILSF